MLTDDHRAAKFAVEPDVGIDVRSTVLLGRPIDEPVAISVLTHDGWFSFQASAPSAYCSFFQIGTRALRASMAKRETA